ncbi:hypothetical protein DM860_003147 [Cuscuta australis]|uniref:GED domain-containing protein n=1 Tax=Cuscuta australis TaxID=267555 RepID=A0A328D2H6_9ASTE|nr:hypothetical protein DM860_003147 [Cuscuta australis]
MEEEAVSPNSSTLTSSAAPLGHSVIPIVNKLQDIFAQLGSQSTIELPQVAVVGSQSSGKSSVLEALVGRDFLPRGSDICTRRPLVLQLLQTKRKPEGNDEWGEFLHLPGKKFYDFNEIRREIQAETDREAGSNKGVSDRQIRLKIFSPNVLDITLVDLPGITKLDIMDRGTDARNFLLGKVIPLRLGYVGVVNRSQEDILMNRSISDALIAEEKFFRSRPVYSDLADRCGVPQLAKKLNQILVKHIKTLLPGLKSRISAALVSVAKEHASFGDITESKAGQSALFLNILSKYSEAFCSMIEGKNEEMSTSELSGGARIHYIFQNIYVKSIEDVDPCEDLTDEDIRTAIQNATGPKSALFVPEVPFEVLVRRQIQRLLDPSLQCVRFIYDELIKMSHRCMANELQRFPVLRRRMDEVTGNFLREGLVPSENMISHIIGMEMDYINTSHHNFIGGSKAVEIASQQIKSSRISPPIQRQKDGVDADKAPASERSLKSRAIIARPVNGIGVRTAPEVEKTTPGATTSWGISSIFGGSDHRTSVKENSTSKTFNDPVQSMEHAYSMIQLREPPNVLRPSENHTDQEAMEITIIKLLLRSYYDIVRKNIEDYVPKAIMYFLVNHTKRELHNVLIKKLYRENLIEEMLQEPDEIATKRKRTRDTLRVLQQAFKGCPRSTGYPHPPCTPVVLVQRWIHTPLHQRTPEGPANLLIPGSFSHPHPIQAEIPTAGDAILHLGSIQQSMGRGTENTALNWISILSRGLASELDVVLEMILFFNSNDV